MLGSRVLPFRVTDIIGHVAIRLAIGHFLWPFGTNPLSVMVSEIFNGECDAMTLNNL